MRETPWFALISILFLLGACVADDGAAQVAVDSHAATIQQDPTVSDVAAEAVALYHQLAARLDERGVTIEELQAAVDAGDEEAVQELFGFTLEEYDAENARVRQVAAELWHASDSTAIAEPEGLRCRPMMGCAFSVMGGAAMFPEFAAGILVLGGMACAWEGCEWDDGPRTKQP